WVSAEAVVLGGEAMHFLIEGDTVLSFQQPQIGGPSQQLSGWGVTESVPDWEMQSGKILTEGYIALQAESHPIDFRNIRLLNLE
ncbi:MAG: family 16 glycoside hydrolase, partial [Bacteroidota bacterium]